MFFGYNSANMAELKRTIPIENRQPELLVKELRQVLRRYEQEDSDTRYDTFERHILPRLQALERDGIPPAVQSELRVLMQDFVATSSASVDFVDSVQVSGLGHILNEKVTTPEPQPALHEQLFAENGGIQSLTAVEIFGSNLKDEDSVRKNAGKIESRLADIQDKKPARDLTNDILATMNQYLREHQTDIDPTQLTQSAADHEYFSNDDLVDIAIRRYLKAVLSFDTKRSRFSVLKGMRISLQDVLMESTLVVKDIFSLDQKDGLGGELEELLHKIIGKHLMSNWYENQEVLYQTGRTARDAA